MLSTEEILEKLNNIKLKEINFFAVETKKEEINIAECFGTKAAVTEEDKFFKIKIRNNKEIEVETLFNKASELLDEENKKKFLEAKNNNQLKNFIFSQIKAYYQQLDKLAEKQEQVEQEIKDSKGTNEESAAKLPGLKKDIEKLQHNVNTFKQLEYAWEPCILLKTGPEKNIITANSWNKEAIDAMVKTAKELGWEYLIAPSADVPDLTPELRQYAKDQLKAPPPPLITCYDKVLGDKIPPDMESEKTTEELREEALTPVPSSVNPLKKTKDEQSKNSSKIDQQDLFEIVNKPPKPSE